MTQKQDLLLIPGLVCDADVWNYQAAHLSDIATIQVPAVARGESMSEMARIVLESAPPSFALAGFSMGGYVALEILRQAPGRITRLALLDTSARGDSAKKAEWRRSAIAACERDDFAGVIERMMPMLLHADQQAGQHPIFVRAMAQRVGGTVYLRRMRAIATRQDARDLLRAYAGPVRAICGRQDGMSTLEEHEEIASLASRGRCSIIEDCGHMTILEQPQAATALLRDWLLYG